MDILSYLYGPYFEKEAAFNVKKFKAALVKKHKNLKRSGESEHGILGANYMNKLVSSMDRAKSLATTRMLTPKPKRSFLPSIGQAIRDNKFAGSTGRRKLERNLRGRDRFRFSLLSLERAGKLK